MDDLISRQAAIDAIESHIRTAEEPYQLSQTENVLNHAFEIAASCVYNLPSVQPERKKGKWIVDGVRFKGGHDWMHCSECGRETLNTPMERTNYCPNCGAKMEES